MPNTRTFSARGAGLVQLDVSDLALDTGGARSVSP